MGSPSGGGYNMQDQGSSATGYLGMMAGGAGANPATAALMGVSLAASIYGQYQAYEGAKKQYGISQQLVGQEMQAEAQRKQMMELNAQRMSTEVIRNQQRARSLALSNSTSQGAQQGSGLQGGYGQISGHAGVGLLGINQQLGAGENLFGINSRIMGLRQQYTEAGSQSYTGSAISGAGQQLGSSARTFGKDFGYLGG